MKWKEVLGKAEEQADWESVRGVFVMVEDKLKNDALFDPRYAVRYAIGFMQYLQAEDMSFDKLVDFEFEDVDPARSL